jgi:hypothetical protein
MARRPPKPPDREAKPRVRRPAAPRKSQKPRSLAELARSPIPDDEFGAAMSEMLGNSDRATCIVFSAMIERGLEDLIVSHLGIYDNELRNLLFERDGALSTFYGNIRFGRALGFYDKPFQDTLDIIRRIRNAFAHSAAPISFVSEEIKRELSRLPNVEYGAATVDINFGRVSEERRQFLSCCLVVKLKILDIWSKVTQDLDISLNAMAFYRQHGQTRKR